MSPITCYTMPELHVDIDVDVDVDGGGSSAEVSLSGTENDYDNVLAMEVL